MADDIQIEQSIIDKLIRMDKILDFNTLDSEYFICRKKELESLNIAMYPNMSALFKPTTSVKEFVDDYDKPELKPGSHGTAERLLGRIDNIKMHGNMFIFNIWENGHKALVIATEAYYCKGGDFDNIMAGIRPNDIIGLIGLPARTKGGEFVVIPGKIDLFAPCLHIFPESLKFPDKYKHKFLDLHLNKTYREILHSRSKIVRLLRDCFESMEFLEVETPIMQKYTGSTRWYQAFQNHAY